MKSKKRISILILISSIVIIFTQSHIEYNVYLPIVTIESGKACWALASRQDMQPRDIEILRPQCFLSWEIAPDNRTLPITHIDMFWCNNEESWQQLHDYILPSSDGVLLFLNEPDISSQCNITPQEGFDTYVQLINEYAYLCVSAPQVSHVDYWNSWQWLREFYDLLVQNNIKMPCFNTVHTYLSESPVNIITSLENMLISYPNTSNSIWITEFGHTDYNVVYDMIDYYENNDKIEYYFYYAPRNVSTAQFVDDTYDLTPSGQAWIELVP